MLLRVKQAPPGIPDAHLLALSHSRASGFREKGRQNASVLFRVYFNGNPKWRIEAPPKFSRTGKPLCFFPDNDMLWSFPGIKTDFVPNE